MSIGKPNSQFVCAIDKKRMQTQNNNTQDGRGASILGGGKLQTVRNLIATSIPTTQVKQEQDHDDARVTDCDVQMFPLDGFGAPVQRYIKNVADVAGSTTNPVAGACLAVVGSVIANKISGVLRGDNGNDKYKVIPNIYCIHIDDAATGKSTAIGEPVDVLNDIDKDLFSRYQDWKRNRKDDNDEDKKLQQIVIGDTTPQAVVSALHDNCDELNNMICGAMMFDDEMSGFFQQANDAKGTNFYKLLCKAFDGKWHKTNRATSGKTIFNSFLLSFNGAIQSDVLLPYLTKNAFACGFFQRFIFTFNDGQKRKKSREGIIKEHSIYWRNLIETLYKNNEKRVVEYDEEATNLYWRWIDNCENYTNEANDKRLIQFVDKHSYFVLRLALIFAVLHNANNTNDYCVTYEDMKNAIRCCNYCLYTDKIVLGFVKFGSNVADLNQDTILHNLITRCVAKGHDVNLKELSRLLGQNPNWASVKENQYKNRHQTTQDGKQ